MGVQARSISPRTHLGGRDELHGIRNLLRVLDGVDTGADLLHTGTDDLETKQGPTRIEG